MVGKKKQGGVKKGCVASAEPRVGVAKVYGIDMPTRSELICGDGKTDDEVCKILEADAVVYQRLEDLKSALHDMNPAIERFECSCFDGEYITGDITEEYLAKLEAQAKAAKAQPKKVDED